MIIKNHIYIYNFRTLLKTPRTAHHCLCHPSKLGWSSSRCPLDYIYMYNYLVLDKLVDLTQSFTNIYSHVRHLILWILHNDREHCLLKVIFVQLICDHTYHKQDCQPVIVSGIQLHNLRQHINLHPLRTQRCDKIFNTINRLIPHLTHLILYPTHEYKYDLLIQEFFTNFFSKETYNIYRLMPYSPVLIIR